MDSRAPSAIRSPLPRSLAGLLLALLLCAPGMHVLAQPAPPAGTVTALARVEGVHEHALPNGLRILLAPDASKPNTTVNMTYLVGSRHENYGQTGMAHLLEHMLFRGTPSLPDALAEFSRRGLQANGSTSADRTNYYASFAADDHTLEWYLRWQADVMINATITREDLDAEMTVVRNEMEMGENSPFQMLLQKMQAVAFQWHNYGHSTIGARSDVENVDIGQLRDFYQRYYQPDNAVLIVSGQFDPQATLAIIGDAFGGIPRPERALPPEYTMEPVQDGERRVSLKRQGGSPLAAAIYHIPAAADPDYAALDLGVDMLSDTPSGPLYRALVREGLASGVFGFAADRRQPGFAMFGAQLEPDGDAEATLQALSETLDTLVQQPVDEADLARARNKWLAEWDRIYADPARLAGILSETVASGDWRLFFWLRDQVERVTADDVQRVLAAWLVPDNRTQGIYVPTEAPVRAPRAQAIDPASMLADYEGRSGAEEVAAFEATPANIDARTERSTLTLDNGPVTLALLPKATRGHRVEARLLLQFADANGLKGRQLAAATTAALLSHGTRDMSRQEIEDRFDALQARVSISGQAGSVNMGLSTTREHLPALVALAVHLLRDADFPQEELDELRRSQLTALNNARAEPHALASLALGRHANPWPADDIRYQPDFDESVAALTALKREDLLDFHTQFYGTGRILFTAVGDFDTQAVKTALAQSLEGWKTAPAYERIPNPWHPVAPKTFDIATPGKANAFYMATLPVHHQDTDPEFAALYLADYLLGSSETSRLWNRVRTREGLSYNIRSGLDLSSWEPNGSWTIHAIFAPENRERLTRAIDEELKTVLEKGFTQAEVDEGIHALINYRRLARSRDGVLAGAWLQYLQTGRSFAWSQDIDDALQGLTADAVNAALRRVFDPTQLSIAIAADPEPANEER
ncbi:MAG: pitrilysin family protein [Castellaniella sp.]